MCAWIIRVRQYHGRAACVVPFIVCPTDDLLGKTWDYVDLPGFRGLFLFSGVCRHCDTAPDTIDRGDDVYEYCLPLFSRENSGIFRISEYY